MSPELEQLMVGYQSADKQATEVLIEQLSPQFFRFFLAQVRDRELAEDLLQDLWLRIHSARHTYRPGEPLLPWMYAIARRVKVDRYRKTRRTAEFERPSANLPETAAPQARESSEIDVRSVLASLPESQREVVLMLKVSGLTLEEVARATRSSVGSVKQKAHRAYTKLRTLLEGSPNAL